MPPASGNRHYACFLRIKVDGTADGPNFGLDHGKKNQKKVKTGLALLYHTLIMRTFVTGKTLGQWLLLAAFVTILYFCFRIMQPFLMPSSLALILSALLSPVYTVVTKKLNNRRSLAAFIVCIVLRGGCSCRGQVPSRVRPRCLEPHGVLR